MLRGGSWNNNPRNCRAANRNRNEPGNRNNNTGFRVALHFPARPRPRVLPRPAPGIAPLTGRASAAAEVLAPLPRRRRCPKALAAAKSASGPAGSGRARPEGPGRSALTSYSYTLYAMEENLEKTSCNRSKFGVIKGN
ncbi:MAG: hypothetical protein HY721_17900 [Planctomycetes bacterium]|nr:hypothetical protein [Planctomycetota bacterium]